MNNKVKVIVAVVLFVLALGAIAYYLTTSRTEVSSELQQIDQTPSAPPPDADVLYQTGN
jgi:hypothetical protein